MTDRIAAFIVVLDDNIRVDDVEPVLTAIRMVKGVIKVTPLTSDGNTLVAEARMNNKWRQKLLDLLQDD